MTTIRQLTLEERETITKRFLKLLNKINEIKAERADKTAQYKAKLKDVDAEIADLVWQLDNNQLKPVQLDLVEEDNHVHFGIGECAEITMKKQLLKKLNP